MIDTEKQPAIVVADAVADAGSASATSFDAILERMKVATNTKSDTAFAKSLGLYQSSVSSAKERQSIPPAWAVQIAETHGVSIDWLMFGEGSKTRKKNEALVKETVEKLQGWTPPEPPAQQAEAQGDHIYDNAPARRDISIADMLAKTARVLESDTVYREALYSNIEAFHHGVTMDERLSKMDAKFDQVMQRLDAMETENRQLRNELEQSRARSTLSDTG